jgi:catechol 1,2-dioxygenase
VLGLSVLVDAQTHPPSEGATQTNVQGPFFRPEAPPLGHPARLCEHIPDGEPLFVSGRISGAGTGLPVQRATVEVWQADHAGRYDVEYPDPDAHHLRGRLTADAEGRYALRTVVPSPYEVPKHGAVGRLLHALGRSAFRPAHLHFKFSAEGHHPLTTMVFFEGDPHLGHDAIGAVKGSLVRKLVRHGGEEEMRSRGVGRAFATLQFDVAMRPIERAAARDAWAAR